MARQLRQPVAVLTTSGTAVLNLAPAVAEAWYQQIPLVVLTADRPLERTMDHDLPRSIPRALVSIPLAEGPQRLDFDRPPIVSLGLADAFDLHQAGDAGTNAGIVAEHDLGRPLAVQMR